MSTIEIGRRGFLGAAAMMPVWLARESRRRKRVSGADAEKHALLWRRLDGSGMEYCRLSEQREGASLEGEVVIMSHGVPWRIGYEIRCDHAWRSRAVSVRADAGTESRRLELGADEHGRWTVGGQVRQDLHDCLDIDLGFSPSTNTLPIRRLRMNVQQGETIDAAWVEFPSLAVHRVPQRYTRVGERTYRYENLPTGFLAVIDVDANGLVVSYPPGWERVHEPSSSSGRLFSPSRSPEIDDAAALYDPLIGSWDVEVIDYDADGTSRTTVGEWHFGWTLEGRAVQDVFIVPRRTDRALPGESRQGNRYGTTVRFYDAALQAWRMVWVNPVSGAVNMLVARQEGDAIVQEGADADGSLMRWTFVALSRDRFHWVGDGSIDGGVTWQTRAEFFGQRVSFVPMR
jgi:uncharacterized protein